MSPFNIIFGVERIGKTTLSQAMLYRYYLFREIDNITNNPDLPTPQDKNAYLNTLMTQEYKQNSISFTEDFLSYKLVHNGFFLNDEGIITSDRRDAMKSAQIKQLKTLNVYAENNNSLSTLTQYLSDLDSRLVKRANFLTLVHKRGRALVFAPIKNLPFINYISTIERIKENPDQIYKGNAIYNLKRSPDFIIELYFSPLPANSPLISVGKQLKDNLKTALLKD